jgi:hypothetical protein
MTFDEKLKPLADMYRAQGYSVTIAPSPDDLPEFARGFKVALVGRRADGGVIAAVKENYGALQDDPDVAHYAKITNENPGWRFDIVVLEEAKRKPPHQRDVPEMTDEETEQSLQAARKLLEMSFVVQAFISAWSLLEAAMRKRLRAGGERVGWGDDPRSLLNQLFSNGIVENPEYRYLEGLMHTRNVLVHGFAPRVVSPRDVDNMLETAGRLLDEARAMRKTA